MHSRIDKHRSSFGYMAPIRGPRRLSIFTWH